MDEFPHTESTTLALLGLTATGVSIHEDIIVMSIKWLLDNQLVTGAWGLTKRSSQGRVLPTVLVLEFFYNLLFSSFQSLPIPSVPEERLVEAYERGLFWLLQAKDPNFARWAEFSFAERALQHPSIPHTALAVRTLLRNGRDTIEIGLEGTNWLAEVGPSQWQMTLESVMADPGMPEVVILHWTHFSLPLCALAVAEGIKRSSSAIYTKVLLEATAMLRESQNTSGPFAGTWSHPDGSDREPVWGIADSILALQAIRDSRPYMTDMDPWSVQTYTFQALEPLILSDSSSVVIDREEKGSRYSIEGSGLLRFWVPLATIGTFGFLFLIFWELGALPFPSLRGTLSELLRGTLFALLGVILGFLLNYFLWERASVRSSRPKT